MHFSAVIFDLDGTLLDSMGVWAQIDIDFLHKRGFTVPEDYVDAIRPLGFWQTALYTIKRFGLTETPAQLVQEWNEMALQEYSHHVKLKPHAKEYLQALQQLGIKLGVATGAPRALFEPALQANGVLEYFSALCCVDETNTSKETPALYLHTAQKLGVEPANCLVLEDIVEALYSARSGGMQTCAVYDEYSAHRWPQMLQLADIAIHSFAEAPLPE